MSDQPAGQPFGLLLSDDLIFTSRVTGTARALGLLIKASHCPENLVDLARQETPRCVVLDLANPGLVLPDLISRLRQVCQPVPRLVAYGSHVDTATLRAAQAAGCDPVWPRSKFVAQLEAALPEWFQTV
jgi:DNA-binding NarL/FixJ family response regulator